jgi:hypothetical protein
MSKQLAVTKGLEELKVSMNAVRDEKRKAQETADRLQKLLTRARPLADLLPKMVEACGFEKSEVYSYAQSNSDDNYDEVYVTVEEYCGSERSILASASLDDEEEVVWFYINDSDTRFATLEEAVVAMNEAVKQ